MPRPIHGRDMTRHRGHTTVYPVHPLGPTKGEQTRRRQGRDPDPAAAPGVDGPFPWRYGWRRHDPQRPCWTCGARPSRLWHGQPFTDEGDHRWNHWGQAIAVNAAAGEWIDEDWRPEPAER